MSIVECDSCHSMSAHPQRSTRAAVIDYNAPDCTRYEYFTEYACANCLSAFARAMPSHSSSAPYIQDMEADTASFVPAANVGDTISWHLPQGIGFHPSASSTRYKGPTRIVNYVERNRARRTAKPSDIKTTTRKETVKEDFCITELNMEMKNE